jgi:two-component system response regulator HydG
MRRVLDVAMRAARSQVAVLLTGENGVGKTMLARYIHEHSDRRTNPLIEVNCRVANGPDAHVGGFVAASGGTLILDEICELQPEAQAKLRAILEAGRVRPVGAGADQAVDARLISVTSRPLLPLLESGAFRRDLLYHINIIPIEVPPLRDRRDDIPELVRALVARWPRPVIVEDAAVEWIRAQPWPGNVRQLASALQRALALSKGDLVTVDDLRVTEPSQTDDAFERGLFVAAERHVSLDQLERAYILRVIDAVAGNMAEAARILRIDRRTLYRKVARSA